MHKYRRDLLKTSASLAALCAIATLGVPRSAQANARWPVDAFGTPSMNEAIALTLGSELGEPSDDILIDAPGYIKGATVFEVTVSTHLPGVDRIAVLMRQHPLPLAAVYHIPQNGEAFVTMRLDIHETTDVIAVVRTQNRLLSNYRRVMVTNYREPELYDPFDDLFELVDQ